MDQRFTIANLINELGHTQIQAMLWRLDHLTTANTTVTQEFDFVTGQAFPHASLDQRTAYLKQIKTDYMQQLGRTWKTQASIRRTISNRTTEGMSNETGSN